MNKLSNFTVRMRDERTLKILYMVHKPTCFLWDIMRQWYCTWWRGEGDVSEEEAAITALF
jgi:hypothetical protein